MRCVRPNLFTFSASIFLKSQWHQGCLPFVRIIRLGRALINGKGFSKITKPTERNGAYHLQFDFPSLFSAGRDKTWGNLWIAWQIDHFKSNSKACLTIRNVSTISCILKKMQFCLSLLGNFRCVLNLWKQYSQYGSQFLEFSTKFRGLTSWIMYRHRYLSPMKLMHALINRISSHNAVRSEEAGFLWSLNTFPMSEYVKKKLSVLQ